MNESEFQAQVIQYAQLLGYRVAHFRRVKVQRPNGSVYHETPVAADGAGWPDLVLVRGKTILFVELKTNAGKLAYEQLKWHGALRDAGQDVRIWRPRDWEEIERVLGEK